MWLSTFSIVSPVFVVQFALEFSICKLRLSRIKFFNSKIHLFRLFQRFICYISFIIYWILFLCTLFNSRSGISPTSLPETLFIFLVVACWVLMQRNLIPALFFERLMTWQWFSVHRSSIRRDIVRSNFSIRVSVGIPLDFFRHTRAYVILIAFFIIFEHLND